MRVKGLNIGFFIVILAIVTIAFFDVLTPYFSAILWAAILAVIFAPLKALLRRKMGDRNGLASFATLVIICLIVFTPLAIITSSLVVEVNTVYTKLQNNSAQFPTVFADLLQHIYLYRRLRRYALSAVLPAERWCLAGGPDSGSAAALHVR